MGDFKSTRDYKLHEKIHREFVINEASLDLLNRAKMLVPLMLQDYPSGEVQKEVSDVLKKSQPIYKFINEVRPYMLSQTFRGNTISNMSRIEEILEMVSKKYHLEAMVKIETIKYQEYVDNPVDTLKEKIKWVTFGDINVKPTKANIKRHRNNVKALCDFLQINEPVMTSYMFDAFKKCFYICKTDYKILLAELKPSDTETMEYLDKKIKSMETK